MDLWLDVLCPECDARLGEFCKWGDESAPPKPHDRRLRVFEAALRLKKTLEDGS